MTKLQKAFATSLTVLFLAPSQSSADEQLFFPSLYSCDPTEVIIEKLESYDEIAIASGDIVVNSMQTRKLVAGKLVFFADPETGMYTLVLEFPEDGISCVMGSGENFGAAPNMEDSI